MVCGNIEGNVNCLLKPSFQVGQFIRSIKVSISIFKLFKQTVSDFVEFASTPASLGHFEKVGQIFKSNIMNAY